MTDQLCAVLLAAGLGTRLRPLTDLRPKALCPVGNEPLLGSALTRLAALGLSGPTAVAVNACWLGEQLVAYLGAANPAGDSAPTGDGPRVHLSWEPPPPLGTAGGLSKLRGWIDGRAVLVGNADAYLADASIEALLTDWDGETVRLLGVPADPADADTFHGYRFAGFSLLPWRWVRDLPEQHGELVHAIWRPAEAAGELAVVEFTGYFRDTGTPADYLAANRHATGGGNLIAADAIVTGASHESVVGAGAQVHGRLTRSVVWPGGRVAAHEHLTDAIRIGDRITVSAHR